MTDHRSKILIIDDRPTNQMTLGVALSAEFEIQIATSGAMGLELAEQSPPDIILLDVMMPDMDGYETCRRIKMNPQLQMIPVVFVTAMAEIDAESTGLALGAADYITKPFNVEIARQRIHNLIERENLRKEVEACRDYLEELVQTRSLAISIIDDAIIMINQDECVSFWNNAAERIFGYTLSKAIGFKLDELILLSTPPMLPIDRIFHELRENGRIKSINGATEHTLLRRDGKKITIELSVSAIYLNEIWKVIMVARDITERKNTGHYITQMRQSVHKRNIHRQCQEPFYSSGSMRV